MAGARQTRTLRGRTAALFAAGLSAFALGISTAAPISKPKAESAKTFEMALLPLFESRCIGCHGGTLPRAGLDLRTRGSVLEGGHSGPAVVPASPEKSLLYNVLASGKMPPTGKKLTLAELQRVAEWIKAGAAGKPGVGHWAFQPPVSSPVPTVKNNRLVRNPIDSFLLSALERKGLTFSPEADRYTLLRRVTFDLIGLPPTPDEVRAFLEDRAPGAYERVVDRLLADPRYGERWARHWLDVAGYADSEGILQEDTIRPNAWRYRDYVIRSFDDDKPYDQFIREQIAGDELTDFRNVERFTPQVEQSITATGFLRTAVDATRADFNTHQFTEYQYRMLNDTETILATAVMGVPLQCARCHDHKYEPLSQKDYYRVQALFAGAIRPTGALLPSRARQIVAAGTAEQKEAKEHNSRVDAAVKEIAAKQEALLKEFRHRALEIRLASVAEADRAPLLEAAQSDLAQRTSAQKALVEKYKALLSDPTVEALGKAHPEFAKRNGELQKERETEERKRIVLTELRAIYDQDANPPPTPLLIRGEWTRPGEAVEPGIPLVLNDPRQPFTLPAVQKDAKTTGRRSALAEWLTRPNHPLTARVIVNRVWAHHFGVGIVPTLENFGRSGAAPTNQALLDWLAANFAGVQPADAHAKTQRRKEGQEGQEHITTETQRHRERLSACVGDACMSEGNPEARRKGSKDAKGQKQAAARSFPPYQGGTEGGAVATAVGPNPKSNIQYPKSLAPWSLKELHRLIVTSAAYRQSSRSNATSAKVDPEDNLLWRQRPRRLEAEALRDAALATAGNLESKMYGEPVGTETRAGGDIVAAGEEKGGRRSIYLLVRRSMPVTVLNTFDAPVMETNCTRRTVSTTATQALALMNSSFISVQAKQFARRILKEQPPVGGDADANTLLHAFRLALSRPPRAGELGSAKEFVRTQLDLYRKEGKKPEDALELAYADFCQALLSANEFVYVD